jgi:universal stress protein A
MKGYDSILVALELAGDEEYLIKAALNVAANPGKIKLVHVCEPTLYPMGPYMGAVTMDAPVIDTEALQQRLTELAGQHSLAEQGHSVCMGRPASEIHRLAKEDATQLVVVGSHGRHGVQLLLGSTANAVLHGACCTVLVVRLADPA